MKRKRKHPIPVDTRLAADDTGDPRGLGQVTVFEVIQILQEYPAGWRVAVCHKHPNLSLTKHELGSVDTEGRRGIVYLNTTAAEFEKA